MMKPIFTFLRTAVCFYVEGFRSMTWGRTLWLIIILKLILFFGVIRLMLLRPVLGGLDDRQKSEFVGRNLRPAIP